jgi:methyl-accepting chemotaxis protein
MTHTTRTRPAIAALAAVLLAAALAPAVARAEPQHAKQATAGQINQLSPQERELLGYAQDAADRIAAAMEKWITGKEITEEKLFSFLYYPIPKTDPPKYRTEWDHLSDRDVLPIEEALTSKNATITYVILVDRNGLIPTHISRYAQPLSGNYAVDLVNNRTKILAQHQVGWKAARSQDAFLIQKYHRDTGESLAELSVPVFVRGQHWGAVRIAYRPVEAKLIAEAK